MANEQITFDKLPQAVGYLTDRWNKSGRWWRHCNRRLLPTSIVLLKLTKPVKSHERQNLPIYTLARKGLIPA